MNNMFLLAIIGVSVVLVYQQFVYGFVDGNNNGKDDVIEYFNNTNQNNLGYQQCYLYNEEPRQDDNRSVNYLWNGSSCNMRIK